MLQIPQPSSSDYALTDDEQSDNDSIGKRNMPAHVLRRVSAAVHSHTDGEHLGMSPAQLYSTESGRLFHSGKVCLIMVGLPARGKTHLSVSIVRYLRWLGVKSEVFHLGDYRRSRTNKIPEDYFSTTPSEKTRKLRGKIVDDCLRDIEVFYAKHNGQVAIYDAVNPKAASRRKIAARFEKSDIKALFIESFCSNEKIIENNVRSVKISSPDYVGWEPESAVKDYLDRINSHLSIFESVNESELSWVKLINVGEQIIVNNGRLGYLHNRIVFFLMSLHTTERRIYMAAPKGINSFKADLELDNSGTDHAHKLATTLLEHRLKEKQDKGVAELQLIVWTSTRARNRGTAKEFENRNYSVRLKPQLSQLNPGVCENLTDVEIAERYPEEFQKHKREPYYHRFPRAESMHDVAVRLEPVILEMEREKKDLLIIAHESVLQILYAYYLAIRSEDIPNLKFPEDKILEIVPKAYTCQKNYIPII